MLKISQKRKERGWSMSELSHKSGVHVSTISLIESGRMRPYPGQAEKLAHALGWLGEPYDLFREEDEDV